MKGKVVPTKSGGAMRFMRKNKLYKYRLAVWSAKDWKFIETGVEAEEPEERGPWFLSMYYDEAFEKVPCKN